MQAEYGEVHGRTGMVFGAAQGRIDGPAGARASSDQSRRHQQNEGRRQQPKTDVVHARERHVGGPDHQRHDPVAEAPYQRRHDHEEHHDEAVGGDQHIVELEVVDELDAGHRQFQADKPGHCATDDAADHGEHHVHGADVLVVGGIQPPPPPGRCVFVRVVGCCRSSVSHPAPLRSPRSCRALTGAGARPSHLREVGIDVGIGAREFLLGRLDPCPEGLF